MVRLSLQDPGVPLRTQRLIELGDCLFAGVRKAGQYCLLFLVTQAYHSGQKADYQLVVPIDRFNVELVLVHLLPQ